MSQNFNERKELPLPIPRMRSPVTEIAHVIVRQDDTGVLAYWTGKAEWAFSVENADAIRFARPEDAQTVLDKVVKPSEGATFYHAKYPDDHLRVEEHMWSEVPIFNLEQ